MFPPLADEWLEQFDAQKDWKHFDKPDFLRVFARGIHDPDAGTVRLTGPQGSGILRSMSLANCLVDLPVGLSRIEPGKIVDVILTEQEPIERLSAAKPRD